MKKVLLGWSFILMLSAVPVSAQIMSNPAQWYINNSMYSTRVFNGIVANSMLRNKSAKGKITNKATKDYTAFKQSPNNVLPRLLAEKSGGDAQTRAKTEQFFASLLNLYQKTAQKDGFPANDLAYALNYFVVNNYMTYHDLHDVGDYRKDPRLKGANTLEERLARINEKKSLLILPNQERAIYNQLKTVLAENAEIQKMNDAQKQEVAELFAIMFGVGYTGYMAGVNNGDDRLMEQARQLAKDGLEKLLGVSVERIKITNNGLEL